MTDHLTTDLKHSPMGDQRETSGVPCATCGVTTWNWKPQCDACTHMADVTYRVAQVMERVAGHVATIIANGGAVPMLWHTHTAGTELRILEDTAREIAARVTAEHVANTHPAQGGAS